MSFNKKLSHNTFYLPTDSILGINNYWYDLLYYERKIKAWNLLVTHSTF